MLGILPKNLPNDIEKVIFLNEKNLEILKGYKALVMIDLSVLPDKLNYKRAYVTIRVTGLSNKAAKALVASLEPLPKNEVFSISTK